MTNQTATREDELPLVGMSKSERWEFFLSAYYRVEEMVRGASDYDANFSEDRIKMYKEDVLARMKGRLLADMLNDVKNRGDNVRLVTALLKGLDDGSLFCSDIQDLGLFENLFHYNLYRFAYAIEHFVERGELLDVIRLVMDEVEKHDQERELLIQDIEFLLQLGMLRLYDYDMTLEGHEELPLEVRMEFSTFYDEDTDADRQAYSKKYPGFPFLSPQIKASR